MQQRAPARWLRAAGADPVRLQAAAVLSGRFVGSFQTSDLKAEREWWQAAVSEVTAASFGAALAALHTLSTPAALAASPNSPPRRLVAVGHMVYRLLLALHYRSSGGGEVAVARACAALLLSSADFRAGLVGLLQRQQLHPTGTWAAAAEAALMINAVSPQARDFSCSQPLVDALLASLAAGVAPGQVGARVELSSGNASCVVL